MKKWLGITVGIFVLAFAALALLFRSGPASKGKWVACRIETELGEIMVRVYPDRAPLTVANFLRYVEAGLFNGTTFFRVVTPANQPNNTVKIEVIQGGDVDEKKCFPPIALETTKMTGVRHKDGTVSMARAEPATATCNFFICINDQPELDFNGRRNPDGQGFAAFGRVVAGMDVVRRIQNLDQENQFLKKPVLIRSIIRLAKGAEIEGVHGKGYRGRISDVFEAIRFNVKRMNVKDFALLFILLALIGWLAWHGHGPRRFGRVDREFSHSGWESVSPGLRLLMVLVIVALAAVFIILMGG
jgi:peptidyl-prolyl cis-trans isomerase A (cyclophilin A)